MADKPYLDKTGLSEFWTAIKDYVSSHGGGGEEQYIVGTKTSDSVTVNKNSVQAANVSASKTGYTPIGIVGITKAVVGSGNVNAICITQYYINSSGNASAVFYNASASDRTMKVTFYILYKKNS